MVEPAEDYTDKIQKLEFSSELEAALYDEFGSMISNDPLLAE